MSLRRFACGNQFLIRCVGIPPPEVFLDRSGKQHIFLQYHSHFIPQVIQGVILHIVTAHQQFAAVYIIQPGNQLHQGGLGRACAANDTDGFTRVNVQVDMAQGQVFPVLGVAEAYIPEGDGAILTLEIRVGPIVLDVDVLVEDFHYTPCGSQRDDGHNKHHGDHHQGHEDLGHIGNEAGQLTNGKGAADDHLSAEPEYRQNTAIHAKLHNGHIQDDQLFRLHLGTAYFIRIGFKLADFLGLPDKCLYHPDAGQVLLYGGIHGIVAAEHFFKTRHCTGSDQIQGNAQNRDRHQEYHCQFCIDETSKDQSAD